MAPELHPDTPYVSPRPVTDLAACAFYHTMEVPGVGVVEGQWDLRAGVDRYLGGIDVRGRRVLEMGTADGYLSFHLERRGADVVSFDLGPDDSWDVVPYARGRPAGPGEDRAATTEPPSWVTRRPTGAGAGMQRVHNAYWFAHRAFHSRARLVWGSVYDVPAAIGHVDVTVFGSLLLHTRDPFRALAGALALTRRTVVVTDALGRLHLPRWLRSVRERLPPPLRRPLMRFMPDWATGTGPDGWWRLTPEIVVAFLGVLGFERSRVTTHRQLYRGQAKALFTVVAQRTDT